LFRSLLYFRCGIFKKWIKLNIANGLLGMRKCKKMTIVAFFRYQNPILGIQNRRCNMYTTPGFSNIKLYELYECFKKFYFPFGSDGSRCLHWGFGRKKGSIPHKVC